MNVLARYRISERYFSLPSGRHFLHTLLIFLLYSQILATKTFTNPPSSVLSSFTSSSSSPLTPISSSFHSTTSTTSFSPPSFYPSSSSSTHPSISRNDDCSSASDDGFFNTPDNGSLNPCTYSTLSSSTESTFVGNAQVCRLATSEYQYRLNVSSNPSLRNMTLYNVDAAFYASWSSNNNSCFIAAIGFNMSESYFNTSSKTSTTSISASNSTASSATAVTSATNSITAENTFDIANTTQITSNADAASVEKDFVMKYNYNRSTERGSGGDWSYIGVRVIFKKVGSTQELRVLLVDDWFMNSQQNIDTPPDSPVTNHTYCHNAACISLGDYCLDGGEYRAVLHVPENKIFAVRLKTRQCGVISVSAHLRRLARMRPGRLAEAPDAVEVYVEAGGGNGYIDYSFASLQRVPRGGGGEEGEEGENGTVGTVGEDDDVCAAEDAVCKVPFLPPSGTEVTSKSQRGIIEETGEWNSSEGIGYTYEIVSDATDIKLKAGTITLYHSGGAFKAKWASTGSFLAQTGLHWASSGKPYRAYEPIVAAYSFRKDCQSEKNTPFVNFVGVHGWTREPVVEYFIVDDILNVGFISPSFGCVDTREDACFKGSFEVDGYVYRLYRNRRLSRPALDPDTPWYDQFYSVRENGRQCGVISVSRHFKKWEEMGMVLGDELYEVQLAVVTNGGTGSVDFAYASIQADAVQGWGEEEEDEGEEEEEEEEEEEKEEEEEEEEETGGRSGGEFNENHTGNNSEGEGGDNTNKLNESRQRTMVILIVAASATFVVVVAVVAVVVAVTVYIRQKRRRLEEDEEWEKERQTDPLALDGEDTKDRVLHARQRQLRKREAREMTRMQAHTNATQTNTAVAAVVGALVMARAGAGAEEEDSWTGIEKEKEKEAEEKRAEAKKTGIEERTEPGNEEEGEGKKEEEGEEKQ